MYRMPVGRNLNRMGDFKETIGKIKTGSSSDRTDR